MTNKKSIEELEDLFPTNDPIEPTDRESTWGIELHTPSSGSIPKEIISVDKRPTLNIEEKESDEGFHYWEPIIVTYKIGDGFDISSIYNWLAKSYQFLQGDAEEVELGSARLTLHGERGDVVEVWTCECYPTSVNFGDMSYSPSSEDVTCELTLSCSNVYYQSFTHDVDEIV